MYKVGINFDEISDDLDVAIQTMKECDVKYGELRTVNQKNFVFWSDEEVTDFKRKVDEVDIELIAAATPLFKWYVSPDDPDIEHDSFGFNPRLSDEEKRQIIERTFEIASDLSIPRLRIFSGLGRAENAGTVFAQDPLLAFALELAKKYNIDLYIENEPVCRVHTKQQIIELLANQQNSRLKLWLDIANLIELDEEIDDVFLAGVAKRLGYVHVKDFVMEDGRKIYLPTGQGQVDYKTILASIHQLGLSDLFFTVETHAKRDKIGASVESIKATKELVNHLNV
ncbi:MAG TPA: sugar phosphate isomerase/epimerase family protein [Candidatus Saccharimonadales bacterium]|nr:sugar phosphate isomerase/epimerase family protein [Candidatus Saccharimonadales bacterium]